MALSAFVGSFGAETATGVKAYTGVGFTPLVVLFFAADSLLTASGSTVVNSAAHFGVGLTSSDRRAGSYASLAGAANVTDAQSATRAIYVGNHSGILLAADLVSMDADGFKLNWTDIPGGVVPSLFIFLALGGTDLTNAKTGRFGLTATGSQFVTGMGFQPDCVLFWTKYYGGNAVPSHGDFSYNCFGAATSSSARWYSAHVIAGTNPTKARRKQSTSACFAYINESGGATFDEFDFERMDADGFTYNVSTTLGSGNTVEWLAIKGGQFKAGTFNEATVTGNQPITGVGFQPSAILLASVNQAASGSNNAQARMSLGVGTSSTQRGTIWAGDRDNQSSAAAIASCSINAAKLLELCTESASSITVNDSLDLVLLEPDGWTHNVVTASGIANEINYLAVGSIAGGGPLYTQLERGMRGVQRGVMETAW